MLRIIIFGVEESLKKKKQNQAMGLGNVLLKCEVFCGCRIYLELRKL